MYAEKELLEFANFFHTNRANPAYDSLSDEDILVIWEDTRVEEKVEADLFPGSTNL